MNRLLIGSRQPERVPWSHEHLKHAQALALGRTIKASSAAAAYGSALNSYISFCCSYDFPIEPIPNTLSFYSLYGTPHQTKFGGFLPVWNL